MFGIFNKKKKSELEKLIDQNGIENVSKMLAQKTIEKIPNREVAYQFFLEELDAASIGNDKAKRFVQQSGISSSEYKGSMQNSMVEVDGPNGPQQFLLAIGMELFENKQLMTDLRIKIVDHIMKYYAFGPYKPEPLYFKGGLHLSEAEVDVVAIVSDGKVVYINTESNHLYKKDRDGEDKLDGRVVNITYIDQSNNKKTEFFIAFNDEESYMMFNVRVGMMERLEYVMRTVFHFAMKNIPDLLNPRVNYNTQYIYAFRLYRRNNQFCMINNSKTEGYIITKDKFLSGSAGEMQRIFWTKDSVV